MPLLIWGVILKPLFGCGVSLGLVLEDSKGLPPY